MATQAPPTVEVMPIAQPDESNPSNDRSLDSVENDSRSQERLVPVSEAIRYRKRAQMAEQQLETIQAELTNARQQLDQSQQTIDALDRRQRIDALLAESEVVDLEVARLLTETAVQMMDEPDVQTAVDDLRRSKPYLFRNRLPRLTAEAMPANFESDTSAEREAANQAAQSGDRRDLLRYLRLRRAT